MVVSVSTIGDDDEIILSTDQGNVIRTRAEEIRTMGRSTQGVTVKKTNGDKITAVARLVGVKEEMIVAHTEAKGEDAVLPVVPENVEHDSE
jgi:DNA gyrase subunit A